MNAEYDALLTDIHSLRDTCDAMVRAVRDCRAKGELMPDNWADEIADCSYAIVRRVAFINGMLFRGNEGRA